MSELRDELIQVAAVAVAIVEDLDFGQASALSEVQRAGHHVVYQIDGVLRDVGYERQGQDEKWGPQHHDIQTWLTILMEEVGEAAKAAYDTVIFPDIKVGGTD